MMSKTWLSKRLVHSCSIERDSGTAQSSSGQPTESWTSVGTGIDCRYYEESERVPSEEAGYVVAENRYLLFEDDQDIEYGDRIINLVDNDDNTLGAGTAEVIELSSAYGYKGSRHHKTIKIERIR